MGGDIHDTRIPPSRSPAVPPSVFQREDLVSRRIRSSKIIDLVAQVRWIVLAVGVAVVLVLLWPRPGARTPEGVTEIHLWVPSGARERLHDALDIFERRHPEYRVIAGNSQLRDATSDPQRFLCGVAGDVPPDLIYFDRFAVVGWALRGLFHPLDDYLAEEHKTYEHMVQEMDAARAAGDEARLAELDHRLGDMVVPELFYEAPWAEASYQRPQDDRPRQWAIPNSVDSRAVYVVDNHLIRAGLVYKPDDPEVKAGQAKPGDIRLPRSWEEVCRKKLEGHAARLRNQQTLTCDAVDFCAAGIQIGDHVTLDYDDRPTLARVTAVRGPHEIEVKRRFTRPRSENDETLKFKIYDPTGYAIRLSEWDDTGRMRVLGFSPLSLGYGNSYLHIFSWSAGGRFFSDEVQHDMSEAAAAEGPQRCILDHPRNVYALQWVADVYDALGGFEAVAGFERSYQRDSTDPLITDKLAMVIDLDGKMNDTIARYRDDMAFTVMPCPLPQSEIDKGRVPITWSGGWSYAIPATARHKDAAWVLMKWMLSEECVRLRDRIEADVQLSQGRVHIPRLSVRPRLNREFTQDFLIDNPHMPARMIAAQKVFTDLLDVTYFRPVNPVGQVLWDEINRAVERSVHYGDRHLDPGPALAAGNNVVNQHLRRVLAPPQGERVVWRPFVYLYAALIVLFAVGIAVRSRVRYRGRGALGREWYAGLVCASPWIIGFLLFTGGPMLFSIVMSFTQYDIVNPAWWIGLDNYRELAADPLVHVSLWNTAVMWLSVPLGLVVGLAMAMLLDTGVRGLAAYRTIYYLPAIVPMVAASILWFWVFNPQDGLLNGLIARAGLEKALALVLSPFDVQVPVKWLQSQQTAKSSLILMSLWSAGSGMLIWLAGLKSVPAHLYEAAAIDGAGPIRRFFNITLPMLSPYVFFFLVMGTIAVLQVFTQAYIMTAGGPNDATLFYAYNLFNQAFRFLRMGYAASLAWMLFVIIMVLTLINLWASKKWVHYETS